MQTKSANRVNPTTIDGITYHLAPDQNLGSTDYAVEGLAILAEAEDRHFWFKTRRSLICKSVCKYVPQPSRILEVGAGTGYVAKGLQDSGYQVSVGEYYLSGLEFARKKGILDCHHMDIFNPPFSSQFDAVGLFDVIEHLSEDINALTKCRHMLKDGGYLFITVPAHAWLWSREDRVAGHKRRYNKATLQSTVASAGFIVIDTRYFFITILPLLVMRKWLHPDRGTPVTDVERKQPIRINSAINQVLEFFTNLENKANFWLPNMAGGSLLLVAQKTSLGPMNSAKNNQ